MIMVYSDFKKANGQYLLMQHAQVILGLLRWKGLVKPSLGDRPVCTRNYTKPYVAI